MSRNRESKHPLEAVRHARKLKRENPSQSYRTIAVATASAFSMKRLSMWTVRDWVDCRTRVPFA